MNAKSVTAVRWLLGLQFLLSGGNWFYKMLPYPNMFDPRDVPLKYRIAEAMIATGWMFQLAKVIEVAAGLSLVFNRFVPLLLTASMSVSVTTFIMDAWNYEPLVAWLSGSGSYRAAQAYLLDAMFFGGAVLIMQGYLMLHYLHVYRPMLAARVEPQSPFQPGIAAGASTGAAAPSWLMNALAVLAIAFGILSTGWLLGMVHQWLIPWSSFAVFLVPRG